MDKLEERVTVASPYPHPSGGGVVVAWIYQGGNPRPVRLVPKTTQGVEKTIPAETGQG